jgi:hypothetical protein
MTNEEEIAELKRKVYNIQQLMVRMTRLLALLTGIPEEDIDKAIMEETETAMRERGEL